MRILLLAAAILSGSCQPATVYEGTTGYSVKTIIKNAGTAGEAGPIHPAVIEYALAAPGSPLLDYFATALNERRRGGGRHGDDLRELDGEVGVVAGSDLRATARAYARARAHRLAAPIAEGLATPRTGQAAGTVVLRCCQTVDPDRLVFADRLGLRGPVMIVLIRYQAAQLLFMRVTGAWVARELSWDLSAVPGAFDPRARLDPATVGRTIVALHEEIR
jgi:hypothetical protein